jgi:DeoR/GlpR family transcriptional regulator of sugar metabolism
LADRQEKILNLLKEKGRAQVWELKQIFPQTSKRTIRRDCECLLKEGMIQRMGERNNTFYQVKSI